MSEDRRCKSLFQQLTLGVVQTLEKRQGVCDIKLSEKPPVDRNALVAWEQKYSSFLPDDVKAFYLTHNGLLLTWKVKVGACTVVNVGHMELNSLAAVTRIGGIMGGSQPGQPSLADLEDSDSDDEDQHPHFDQRSRIFELDPCQGHGKVVLVYKDTKPGLAAYNPEVWFLDRSLQWHFLADSFSAYYRLMIMHLGLPQWQYAFTDIGLSPEAKQWFNLYAPVRMEMDSNSAFDSPGLEETQMPVVNQLDIGKVFKGKSDKKKQQPMSTVSKKKPAVTSARSQPGSGSRPGLAPVSQFPLKATK